MTLFFINYAFAQAPVDVPLAGAVSKEVPVEKKVIDSWAQREDSTGTFMVGYQMFTTWVPFKRTISYTQILNSKWSIEGEYSWFSWDYPFPGIDLGEISEKKYSLMAKYYSGNSFHFSFGPYFTDFEARLGNDILGRVSGSRTTTSIGAEVFGATGGVGNRWQWGNGFTLGIDWLRLSIPIAVTNVDTQILSDLNNEGDQEDIRKVIRRLQRVPTFVLLGLSLGYTF